MQIYLPIAEMSLNAILLLGLGGMVGFLSGMFGVGGGFLMTPLLIFIGVPPAVAVGTEANQVVAASVSGALAHWRRGNVDIRMGVVLLIGGFIGSTLGIWLFTFLRSIGHIDFVISVSYVLFLGIIGVLMVVESGRSCFGLEILLRHGANCTNIHGFTACRSRCGFADQNFTSARCCRSGLEFSLGSWQQLWVLGAVS